MKSRKFDCAQDYVVVCASKVNGVKTEEVIPQNSIMDASCVAGMKAMDGYSCVVYNRDYDMGAPGVFEVFFPIFKTNPVK